MHETTTKRPGRAGKYIRRALLALAAVILAAVLVLLALFQAELRTLNTIERVDDTDLFTMTYLGDYGLDDFLAQGGASNDNELLEFLMQKLLKGLPLRFDIPDLGCSTFAAETPEGDAIFGRNFDMYYSPALFVRTAPEDGYRSISMVNLSYIGFGEDKLPTSLLDSLLTLAAPYVPLDGLNEKGLAVGVLLIDTEPTDQQTDKPDITTTTAIRLLLDRAASHVPLSVTLTSLAVQPLSKTLEEGKDPVFASKTLSIRGVTNDASAVSELMTGLRSEPPLREARLEGLKQNRESGATEFKITVAL